MSVIKMFSPCITRASIFLVSSLYHCHWPLSQCYVSAVIWTHCCSDTIFLYSPPNSSHSNYTGHLHFSVTRAPSYFRPFTFAIIPLDVEFSFPLYSHASYLLQFSTQNLTICMRPSIALYYQSIKSFFCCSFYPQLGAV